MNDLVGVADLLNQVTSLSIIHTPDFLDAPFISLFKPFKSLLELDELIREKLVLLRVLSVQILCLRLLHPELLMFIAEAPLVLQQLLLQALLLLREDLLALKQHIVVEPELLLIQLVYGLHILHALLEDLHLRLELNFLLSLLVSVLTHGAL